VDYTGGVPQKIHRFLQKIGINRWSSFGRLGLVGLSVVGSLGAGCASPNVNPRQPRANTGYVDCFADSGEDLYWEVQQFDASTQQFKKTFSRLDAAKDGFLRLAFPPGHYQFRIGFLNQVIAQPAFVEVEVLDGLITPVRVELTEAGVATVQTKQTSVGGTVHGRYGRRTKIGGSETASYKVTALPQPPQSYRPKQLMPYSPQRPR
jgi:hypothetical protein